MWMARNSQPIHLRNFRNPAEDIYKKEAPENSGASFFASWEPFTRIFSSTAQGSRQLLLPTHYTSRFHIF
jgi:hypothetical protein